MNLLHIIPTYVPAWRHGGPVVSTHGLCRALVARGHEVTVFTTDVHGDERLDVPLGEAVDVDGVEVYYFPVGSPRRLYRSPAMGAALRQRMVGFDLAHLHALFLWPTAAAARAARAIRVPYLVAPRGMLVEDLFRRRGRLRKRLWLNLVDRRTLERAAGLHVTGAVEAAEARRFGLSLPPLFDVPNGVDVEDLRPTPGAPLSPPVAAALDGGPFLLFLGRLTWKKGLDRLLAALARLPGARAVVAGNDEEGLWPRLARHTGELGVAGRVAYVGAVAGADKTALLESCAALVLPSHSENFGNAVLEAMAVGRPVVVTPEVGLAPVVAESGAGLVVEGEAEALATALESLLGDGARRAEMGRRGAAVAARRFSWPAVARQMEEAYEAVLAARRAPASSATARAGGGEG